MRPAFALFYAQRLPSYQLADYRVDSSGDPARSSPKFFAEALRARPPASLNRHLQSKSRNPEGDLMRESFVPGGVPSPSLASLLLCRSRWRAHRFRRAKRKGPRGSVFVPDKGKLNILLDGKSVGREEFEIASHGTAGSPRAPPISLRKAHPPPRSPERSPSSPMALPSATSGPRKRTRPTARTCFSPTASPR